MSDQWTNPTHQQFADDMEAAGRKVRRYKVRFSYDGPAVDIDLAEQARDDRWLRATRDMLRAEIRERERRLESRPAPIPQLAATGTA